MSSQNHQRIVADGGAAITIEKEPNESASQAVLRGVASAKETSVRDLRPLYERIEPESLDNLLQHSRQIASAVSVEFTYEGYTVVVQDEEILIVDGPPNSGEL